MAGPLSGIHYIHKAIQTELDALEETAQLLDGDRSSAGNFRDRLSFLRAVVRAHAAGEEAVLYPAVDKRVYPTSATYVIDHDIEQAVSEELDQVLSTLAGHEDSQNNREALLRRANRLTIALNVTLTAHIRKEEEHLVPLAEGHFSDNEQEELVAQSMAHYRPEQLQQVLPWMMRALTEDEQEAYLRELSAAVPAERFQAMVQWIEAGLSPEEWASLVRRVRQLTASGPA